MILSRIDDFVYLPCKSFLCFFLTVCIANTMFAQPNSAASREKLLMDSDWKFAFGHPHDAGKDFNNGTGYFSYLAKTGYGDGAASPGFDDRSWRKLDLPHDWAVEQGFSEKASLSHGFKAIGRNFPEVNIGWYRKTFKIPSSDLGRRIHISFDGVYRNAIVWINGHYLGTHPSGYLGFEYDISDYLNYDGDNVIAVRVDATMEEGWFYEGAGIYRHVWLNKLDEVHVVPNGTFVQSRMNNKDADLTALVSLINEGKIAKSFSILQEVFDADGKKISSAHLDNLKLNPFETKEFSSEMNVTAARLWSLENPYLHKLVTTVKSGSKVTDRYETTFGIRTIRFDANRGFFLNGKNIKIKGTNNHQDHAGVGVALPDKLQEFRINALKQMGSNAYRCAHNPPTPELLDACDRLGMLVIDENRLMGIASTELDDLKRLILRDRNHPSIISWSIGNEEWGIEGNITGARIAETMQVFAKSIDTTRFITAAISGGVGSGISTVVDVMGYNYIATKNTDEHHAKYPWQKSWGTEEGSTVTSRGIYRDNRPAHQLAAYDKKQNDFFLSLEDGWKHYAVRPYLAGMFIWTGFDYRGEPTPFTWPSTGSYFGMLDQCGFPKDYVFYLRSWWTDQPTIHILPHWNWKGREGQDIDVWVYSNAEEVELFLNGKSQGKKAMERNGHLEWKVKYVPGTLKAVGYSKNVKAITDVVSTTSDASAIHLSHFEMNGSKVLDIRRKSAESKNDSTVLANKEDIAVITVDIRDKNGLHIPTAANEIKFSIDGPGRIIGVGNGDPTSLEPDQYLESIYSVSFTGLKEKIVEGLESSEGISAVYDDSLWKKAFSDDRTETFAKSAPALVYRGNFLLKPEDLKGTLTFYYNSIGKQQSIYINGKEIAKNISESKRGNTFKLDASLLNSGNNIITIVATPLVKKQSWDVVNQDIGLIQIVKPAEQWKRKLFSGLAQIIIQSTGEAGSIVLKAEDSGLKQGVIRIKAKESARRPFVK